MFAVSDGKQLCNVIAGVIDDAGVVAGVIDDAGVVIDDDAGVIDDEAAGVAIQPYVVDKICCCWLLRSSLFFHA